MRVRGLAVAGAAMTLVVGTAAPASANDDRHRPQETVTVVAKGLNGPREIQVKGNRIFVAESDTGEISRVNLNNGRLTMVVGGLGAVQGVDRIDGRLVIATGEGEGPPAPNPNSVLRARIGGDAVPLVDLFQYELDNNVDEQVQFVNGQPVDALSNPYYVLEEDSDGHGRRDRDDSYALVADAGANAIYRVSRSGDVAVLAVLPVVRTGACANVPNNPGTGNGCDPVPTGMAYGPDGLLYVSALTSEVPGEGRVYKLNPRTGRIVGVITGFTSPTGVAVGDRGEVYVSELFYNAPEGEDLPPGFDPSTVGRIVKVDRHGQRTYAAVTMPTGLDYEDGELYASAWSVAIFLGIEGGGQIVQVHPRAFTAELPV